MSSPTDRQRNGNGTIAQRVARYLLIVQALGNVLQGLHSIFYPSQYAESAGFSPSQDNAIQSIGLGSLGMGVYGLVGAISGDRVFFYITSGLRLAFAALVLLIWGRWGVASYELIVAGLSWVAA